MFAMALTASSAAFAGDAMNLPESCRSAVYAKMQAQGLDADDWGSILNVNFLQNYSKSNASGVAYYQLTNARGDKYVVQVDYNKQPNSCVLVK
jgi:hypothetical protein